jgi:DNA-binding GntR family transcriptional regulator
MQSCSTQLVKQNLSDEIANRLRVMILDARLPAGGRINEVHLARLLGVSRTPLREALSSLASEGAVTVEPRKGFFTAPLTAEELEELYAIRPILDPEALRLAGIPPPARLERLRALNGQLGKERDPQRIIELDDEWHFALVAECPNRTLLALIEQMMRRTRRYELAYMRERVNVRRSQDQHATIIGALEASDMTLACQELKRNMQSGNAPVLKWLRARDRQTQTKEKRVP